MTDSKKQDSLVYFILYPAIAMLLGWGLRGFIGGGPFAAMIPGVYVALGFSLLFRHDLKTAAIVAIFGAIGIGYGGDMTYGQTLGLAREPETMFWGFLGCAIKGGVWGLLGGAVMAVGLTRHHYQKKDILIALLITIVGFYLGWKLINEPKLIYFSDQINKPRDESWAGLLFAAIGFIAYLRMKVSDATKNVPLSFALWGALGGAIGFAGGTIWLVFGPYLPVPKNSVGWWKFMEFSFGLLLGAFLGLSAYRNRVILRAAKPAPENSDRDTPWPAIALALWVSFVFAAQPQWVSLIENLDPATNPVVKYLAMDFTRVATSFIFFGAVCLVFGLASTNAAWQGAITLTFFHTMVDILRDLAPGNTSFGYALSPPLLIAILFASNALVAYATVKFLRGDQPLRNLYLLIIWSCMAVATWRSFGKSSFWVDKEGQAYGFAAFFAQHSSELITYAIFLASALITTYWTTKLAREVKTT